MNQLTILMPCLNETKTLPGCIDQARRFLDRTGIQGEILIADNGSTDGSPRLARELGARVILVRRKGYGAALRAGIRAADSPCVIMGDSDGSYDFAHLDGFWSALRDGADLVVGIRHFLPDSSPWLHRYVGVPVLSALGRQAGHCQVQDFHCGLRGVNRERFLELGCRCTGMEFASEMILRASRAGHRICQVPTTLAPDGRQGPSHIRAFRDGLRHLRVLWNLRQPPKKE